MASSYLPLQNELVVAEDHIRVTGYVLPVGNGAVGKTSVAKILYKFEPEVNNYSDMLDKVSRTNNLEFEFTTSLISLGKTIYSVTTQILVPPGQKARENGNRNRSFSQVVDIYSFYIKAIDVLLLTYNIADRGSFIDLGHWIKEATRFCQETTQVILLGTHLDVAQRARAISLEEVERGRQHIEAHFSQNVPNWQGACLSLEVSNLNGKNIEELKFLIAKSILWSRGYIGGYDVLESYNFFVANQLRY